MAQQVDAVASLDATEKSELRAESEQIHLERFCKETSRLLSALKQLFSYFCMFMSAVNISERNPVNLISVATYNCKQAIIELLHDTGRGESKRLNV